MTRIFWLRHGPTHEKTFVGHRDVPADLSDTDAIARLDAALPAGALVVASDLRRASDTASAVQGARDRLPDRPALREFDFGDWDGLAFEAIAAGWPDLSRRYWEAPGDVAPPGGESWNAAAARINAGVDALIAAHPGRDIIAVAHIGVILTQVQRAQAIPAEQALSHRIDNLSLTEIAIAPRWQTVRINHLP